MGVSYKQRNGARTACNTTPPRRWQASCCRPTQPSYATSMDRDGERNSPSPRNSQAATLKSLAVLMFPRKQVCASAISSLCSRGSIRSSFTCPRLNTAASAARIVRTSRSSVPSLIVGRIEYVIAMLVIGEATHYSGAMTAIVLKISPRPHYGDDELRAGAAWRGWCCLLTACDIQLGLMMSCELARTHM
jgi:hypothetical protein